MKLSALYIASVASIFFVPYKIYPILFILFSIFIIANSITNFSGFAKVGCYGISIYMVYVLFNLSVIDFNYVGVYKFITNFFFLIASLMYFEKLDAMGRLSFSHTLKNGLAIVIILNFLQVFVSVALGGLWLNPFVFTNSEDAYAIQNSTLVIIGDENKNIWASKFLMTYLWLIYFQKIGYFKISYLMHAISFFVIFYTSSRTAQIALLIVYLMFFLDAYIYQHRKFLAFLGGVVVLIVWIHIIHPFVLNYDVSAGHGGDGLFARIILWRHFLDLTNDMSMSDYFFGHGISAAEIYMFNIFQENNWHNVLINQFYAFGAVGVVLYLLLVFKLLMRSEKGYIIILPIVVIASSQYSGYEPELLISFSFLAFGALPDSS
jgi:hypothetical protein